MGSEEVGVDAGTKTPPRLCYHALPSSQRPEPLGMMTPPLQAPGSVPFRWEVAPGKPRNADEPHSTRPKPASARGLEPPPGTVLLSASSTAGWQVAKVADAEVPAKAVLEGPYYVLLRPPASLFDGPSVMARSSSFSSASFGRYPAGEEGKGKERPAAWFWKRAARRKDGGSSLRKKGGAAVAHLPRSSSTNSKRFADGGEGMLSGDGRGGPAPVHVEAAAAAASVSITRIRRSGSLPNLSAAGTHLWVRVLVIP